MEKQLAQFEGRSLEVIDLDGRLAMTAEMVGIGLGYSEPRIAVNKIFNRHADEFEKGVDYTVTNLPTAKGDKEMIVFFQTGVNLLGFFSKQPLAKAFRRWAKYVLSGTARVPESNTNIDLGEYVSLQQKYIQLLEAECDRIRKQLPNTRRRSPRPFTDADRQKIIDLYKEGLSQAEIARRLNRSAAVVSYTVRAIRARGEV